MGRTFNVESFRSKETISFFLVFILIFFAVLVGAIFFLAKFNSSELISPLVSDTDNSFIPTVSPEPTKKEVIGFLPFWTIKEAANFQYSVLTQIIYMGITFDGEGLVMKDQAGWTNWGGKRLTSVIEKAKKENVKVLLGIESFNDEDIEKIITDQEIRKKVILATTEFVEEQRLDGINVDFEYSGFPSLILVDNFTNFMKELATELKSKSSDLIVSVDVHADSVVRSRIYEIKDLGKIVDQVIIMGYDFHRMDSGVAGPVAPLQGNAENPGRDLTSLLSIFYQLVEPKKLILAVPYYGYEWETVGEDFGTATHSGSGALATYKRTMTLIEEKQIPVIWNEGSQTPWLTYKIGAKIKQIYFDNEKSLGLKFDLVNQSGMGGVGIWALGYDGNRPELWSLLKEKFNN